MIFLDQVTHFYQSAGGFRVVLRRATVGFPVDARIGILARPGTGKTSLIRLLCGVDAPSIGEIYRTCAVSWPIGYAGGLHPDLTGDENVRIVARICGRDPEEVSAFCHDFSELGHDFFQTLDRYSGGMRARLGMALSMAIEFDLYLADESVVVGDDAFRRKCEAALDARLAHSGLVLVSRNPRIIEQFCEFPAVLVNGEILFCDSHKEAKTVFEMDNEPVESTAEPAVLEAEGLI